MLAFISLLMQPLVSGAALTPNEQLGKFIFFDTNLSTPIGQSCGSCHAPHAGFADPDNALPVSEGVIPGRFGRRNSPTASYAALSPNFTTKAKVVPGVGVEARIVGGQFWDGRAANLVEQAKGPFLNPIEMNNPSKLAVIDKIRASTYAPLFREVYGQEALTSGNEVAAYDQVADAIAAYEKTSELNKFTSKFDYVQQGRATFTAQETLGRDLFVGKALCSGCHTAAGTATAPATFSDFFYDNVGVPRNALAPFAATDPADLGLGATLNDPKQNGKFKTPHLRNAALTAPYMHNGVLLTLKQVVNFYNTRDIPGMWPPAEVAIKGDGAIRGKAPTLGNIGNLGLTSAEEDAIVAFLMTLTDDHILP